MADKKPGESTKREGSDLEDPNSKKPRGNTDQSQGSEPPQDAQPVEPPSPVLPNEYEWRLCDMTCEMVADEVTSFIKKFHLQEKSIINEAEYSKEFLKWSLRPPNFMNWHLGVEDKSTKELVAFIAAVPINIKLHNREMLIAEVKCLYILEKPKSQGIKEILLLEEMDRIVTLQGAQLAYGGAPDDFPTSVPLATCQCWIRPLNVEKLVDLKFITLGEGVAVKTLVELNELPATSRTKGLRIMEARDIPSVTALLRSYVRRFAITPDFNEFDVKHWLLPRANIIESYVGESGKNREITHFISYYVLPFSNRRLKKDSSTITTYINAACLLYNVSSRKIDPVELLVDALIVAKWRGFDIFKVLDIMDNTDTVLKLLLFRDKMKHNYYLHNHDPGEELKSSQVGFVMF